MLGADGAPALRVPPLPRDVVRRPRLHRLLDESLNTPLTLIAAPAGFGKTTLLGSWATTRPDVTVAWISCDAVADGPGFWLQLLELTGGGFQATGPDTAVDAALERLAELHRPVVVLVDDFHLVRSKHVLGPLARLLAHPPPNVHVVLASRRDPDLPLHRLRLAGQLTELRAKELAFTPAERPSSSSQRGSTCGRSSSVHCSTGPRAGAAALRFAALSLRTERRAESFVLALARTEQAVAEYLVAEVLGAQPPRVREFLLYTSICDRLDGALADDLTGKTDGARTLSALERDNVFLELDPDGRWYRYHTLFAGLLRAEAQRTHGARLPELHRRAAHSLARRGDRLAALRHALAAGDAEQAESLVSGLWVEIDGRADDRLASAILDRIEPRAVRAHPHLCLLAAWDRLRHGDLAQTDAWLKLAATGSRTLDPVQRAAFDFGRSVVDLRRTVAAATWRSSIGP